MATNSTTGTTPGPHGSGVGTPVLSVKNVGKRYGGVVAVDDISLSLNPGDRVGVIGPNGAGKTTLFKMIAGDVPVSNGTVELFGQDVTKFSTAKRARMGVGRTFQISNLFAEMSVLDNVRIAARGGTSKARVFWKLQSSTDEVHERSVASLESVGLGGRLYDTVADLSHGEQRQLEFAMAMAGEPQVLLLDEPAAGLSSAERATLKDLIEKLPRTLTVLLIEHDMSLALGLTDRVMCMDNGRHVVTGTPDEVRDNDKVKEIYLGRRGKK